MPIEIDAAELIVFFKERKTIKSKWRRKVFFIIPRVPPDTKVFLVDFFNDFSVARNTLLLGERIKVDETL